MSKELSFSIPPDRSLIGKLGARSRAFPMVVTELVDNSLDSWMCLPKAKQKKLKIEIIADGKNAKSPYFVIKDNAGGMTEDELGKAMRVGFSDKSGKNKFLGHFGFGLKSACMYIGSEFEIFTCSHEKPGIVLRLEFNRKDFELQTGTEWKAKGSQMSNNEAARLEVYFPDGHGTEIRIKNEKYVSANKIGIQRRLSRIFGPRLPKNLDAPKISGYKSFNYGDMEIIFNNEKVQASGVFYEKYVPPTKTYQQEAGEDEKERGMQPMPALSPKYINKIVFIPELKIRNRTFKGGFAAIMDRGMGHSNEYGFDLLKNGRVIEMHALDRERSKNEKDHRAEIGLPARNHYARIYGQLFFDDPKWETDNQKTEFIKDDQDSTWSLLAQHVAEHIAPLLKISSDLQEPQKARASKDASEKQISKLVSSSIPDISDSVQKAARQGGLSKVLANIDDNKKKDGPQKAPQVKEKISNTKIVQSKPQMAIVYSGKDAPSFTTTILKSEKEIIVKVKINADHPFIKKFESGERKAIAQFITVDAYAAYVLKSKNIQSYDDFVRIRETLLADMKRKL